MCAHLISNDKGHKNKLRNEMIDRSWKSLIVQPGAAANVHRAGFMTRTVCAGTFLCACPRKVCAYKMSVRWNMCALISVN